MENKLIRMHVPMFDLKVSDDSLRQELLNAVDATLQHGRIILGPEVQEFEKQVAQFVGMRFAVGLDSGSSALYLALKSVGIGPGDEVITTPLTWIITLHAIAACGAIPVCVDVRDDCNIDPQAIEQAITSKTKAIVCMHYAGKMCAMDEICSLAEKKGLYVIEDAAQAFGAEYRSKKAGAYSIIGAFSMNSMKPFSSYGEAGAVVTDDPQLNEKIRILRHAGTKSDPQKLITNEADYVALNHKMDTIQAAMLLVSMKRLSQKMDHKSKIAAVYQQGLSNVVKCPDVQADEVCAYYTYPIQVDRRDELKKYLQDHDIESKIFHVPLACDAPVYRNLTKAQVPNARRIMDSVLSLPCHEAMDQSQAEYVVDTIQQFYKI